jgi:hypothetical protein
MTDQDLLLHRFVDHDLSPEERLAFLQALDRDEALRRRLVEIETVLVRAAGLPRLSPPHGFTNQVLARLPAPPQGWVSRLRASLLARPVGAWRLAQAVVVACGIFAIGLMVGRELSRAPTEPIVPETAEAERTVYVRFTFLQPHAESVTIAGDFNGWDSRRSPLRRSGSGLWTITLLLKPGRYAYMYVVDGRQWVADPFATELVDDGFGAENAVLEVGDRL